MAIFERHVRNMIRAIPKDGSTTVDLHDLFFAMSLDIATEFLFGESVGLLQGGDEKRDEKTNEFVEAFQYAQDTMEGSMEREWGILGLFLPDKKFRRSCATVHGKCAACGPFFQISSMNTIHRTLHEDFNPAFSLRRLPH